MPGFSLTSTMTRDEQGTVKILRPGDKCELKHAHTEHGEMGRQKDSVREILTDKHIHILWKKKRGERHERYIDR